MQCRRTSSKEILNVKRITKKRILELCKKDKLYQTPELNDVLYLHYQGFDCIECLEDYTELKCLWLECNAIAEIQGLDKQAKLKCLFLQSNLIRKIENLEYCKELDTINLSQNHIRKIENCGFEVLPVLNTLNLASNYLRNCEDLKELENCKNLSVLDLSNNRIDDILVVKIFSSMPELKVLVLQGNPVVSKIPQYRKTLTLECKKLTYLDSRPVFPKDRACAEAWKRGGYEEERKENERWNRKERKKMKDSVNATINLRNKNRKLEDQISLIPTSDSEDDTKEQKKRNLKTSVDSEDCMDCIWDEVAGVESLSDKDAIDCITNNMDINDEIIKDQQFGEENKIRKGFKTKQESCKEFESLVVDTIFQETNPTDSDTNQEKYETIIAVIENIAKPENFVENQNEYLNATVGNDEENYEPLKELEKNMNLLSQEFSYEQSSSQFERIAQKTIQELENDDQYVKINKQLEGDFFELTTNLSNFVNQLEKKQDELDDVMKREWVTKEGNCESSDHEDEDSLEILTLDRKTGQWDTGSNIKIENVENKIIPMTTNNATCKLNHTKGKRIDNLSDKQQELTNSFTTNNAIYEKFEADRANEISAQNANNTELFRSFEYKPMDVSMLERTSDKTLKTYERESEQLKKLLEKLENNNEELFKDIELKVKKHPRDDESCEVHDKQRNFSGKAIIRTKSLDKNIIDDIKENEVDNFDYNSCIKEEKIKKEDIKEDRQQIAEIIIDELLQSLDTAHMAQKSYEFPGLMENYEQEYEISHKKQSQCKTETECITEVIQSFNQFLDQVEINQQKNKSFSVEYETLQSLDAQLEKIKRNKKEKVRRMVDRVHAQKDRYNDTLEFVDNKLMVRNNETKELQELPQPLQQNLSESEEDYDTAHSEVEEKNGNEKLRIQRFRPRSYKPTKRKTNEDLIIKALNKNNPSGYSDNSEEESDDEFFSLDSYDDKQILYNTDQEFLNKLTFDFSNFTEIDENHIAQCAKSYQELKNCLTLGTEDICFTKEDMELPQNIIKMKSIKVNDLLQNPLKSLENNCDLSREEQLTEENNEQEQIWLDKTTPKYQEPKNQAKHEQQYYEKACNEEDGNFKVEKNSEIIMENESRFAVELQSEEENNEIEDNIELGSYLGCAKKLYSKEKPDNSMQNSKIETEKITTDDLVLEKSAISSCDLDVLECNLEIIAENDEVVDNITISAQLNL